MIGMHGIDSRNDIILSSNRLLCCAIKSAALRTVATSRKLVLLWIPRLTRGMTFKLSKGNARLNLLELNQTGYRHTQKTNEVYP